MAEIWVLNGWAASPEAWSLCRFAGRASRLFSYRDQLDGADSAALAAAHDVILVGWSMGGSSALRLYLAFPEKVRALVLIAATPRMMSDENWPGMSPRRLAALEYGLLATHGEGFMGLTPGRPNPYWLDDETQLKRGLAYLRTTDLRTALETRRDEVRAGLRPAIPVAIFQSERDGIVRASNAAYLKTIFPQATCTIVAGGEHALPVSIPSAIDAAVAAMEASGEGLNV